MSTALRLDKLSLSMEEGVVVAWLVADGDEVAEGQPIVEIETDKATEVVESPAAGVIRIVVGEGEVVPVETLLAEIGAGSGGSAPPPDPGPDVVDERPEAAEAAPEPPPAPLTLRERRALGNGDGTVRRGPVRSDGSPVASPAARALARRTGVELAGIGGSGPGGRIVVADVRAAAGAGSVTASPAAGPAPATEPLAVPTAPAAPSTPGADLRAAVVASLQASWAQIPHIHIGGELDVAGLTAARRATRGRADVRVTATDLLVLALARALVDVPALNGTNVGDGPRLSRSVNLGLAVATERDGVVAPVIRDAAELSIAQVARERSRLVEAARAGALERRDLAGGTFTLSNLGAHPVDFFAPVIAGPQIAMLAVGRAREVPVARDGLLGVGTRMWANVAIDHRSADGEAGGRLLAALERRIADLPILV